MSLGRDDDVRDAGTGAGSGASWLVVDGDRLTDAHGAEVRLRGVGLGGWLNMENFITGFPGTETLHRRALLRHLGQRRFRILFNLLLGHFFTDEDAALLSSLGLNAVRIPLNYRHLEDDLRPGEIREDGFVHLDRAVESGARHGLYVIIDLHSLPGSQNHHWHSDNRIHAPLLFEHRDFQDRTVGLWRAIASHYRDDASIAGYNLINEPSDEDGHRLVALYRRLEVAIREVDDRHILFLDGNRYAQGFADFGELAANSVYAIHHYPLPGSARGGAYPGLNEGIHYDRDVVRRQFHERTRSMREHHVPIWVGEFGPVYSRVPAVDEMRRRLLRDQLEIYASEGASWSLWTYKSIGVQGLVYVRPDAPWMTRTSQVRAMKQRLGTDSWGMTGTDVEALIEPLVTTMARAFPDYDPYPFGLRRQVELLVRNILFAEPLVDAFARAFADAGDDELEELGASFDLSSCTTDEALLSLLAASP